jgi:hypothetical protein
MGPVTDVQPLADVNTLARERSNLLQQSGRVDYHTISDDAIDARPENSGGNQ